MSSMLEKLKGLNKKPKTMPEDERDAKVAAVQHFGDMAKSAMGKKIGGLKKFIKGFENHHLPVSGGRSLFDTFVEVQKETTHHVKGQIFKAEVKLYLPGKSLFASSNGDDLMKTISEVRDELEGEIRKHKSKVVEFPRRKAKKRRE